MSNFIKTKHRKRGKTRNKRKGPMSRPKNKNGQQGGQVRGAGNSHAVDLIVIRSMLEKERGGTQIKNTSRIRTLTSKNGLSH
jgi:hypothetical protein